MASALQLAWSVLAEAFSHTQLYCLAYVVFLATYWGFGLAFLAFDCARPAWGTRFKCQPKYPDTAMVAKVAHNVVLNQLSTYPAVFIAMGPIAARRLDFAEELPGATIVLWHLLAYALLTEVVFYYSHRAMHCRLLYRFHKVHHEVKAPFAICAIYFHPIEHALAALQGAVGPLLLGSHVSLYYLWTFIATLNVLIHHSGYNFEPYVPDSLWPVFQSMTHQHDYHHLATDRNFGVIGILDRVHGTDTGFEDHMAKWGQARS